MLLLWSVTGIFIFYFQFFVPASFKGTMESREREGVCKKVGHQSYIITFILIYNDILI